MEYDNNNSGVLFKNDRKEKDSHPDYRGNIEVDGKEYYIKGWKKESKRVLHSSLWQLILKQQLHLKLLHKLMLTTQIHSDATLPIKRY